MMKFRILRWGYYPGLSELALKWSHKYTYYKKEAEGDMTKKKRRQLGHKVGIGVM